MSTLQEMMAFADRQSGIDDPLAGNVQHGIMGFMAGQEQKKVAAKQKLDTYLKLLDIQEKVGKIKQAEQERKTQESFVNMMKANGMIPYSEDEKNIVRRNMNNAIGEDPLPTPEVNTESGKLGTMLKESYDMLPTYDGKNFGMRFSKNSKGKGLSPTQEQNLRIRIYDKAKNAAIDKKYKQLNQNWDTIKNGPLTRDNVSMNLTQDEIAAFIPEATKYIVGGDIDPLRKKGMQDKKEAFPLGDPTSTEFDNLDFNSLSIDEED